VGSDPRDAFFKIEAAESIAKTLTIARLLGGEAPLQESQIATLYQMRKKNLGKEKI